MHSSESGRTRVASTLGKFYEKGVRLWVENDQLRYRAPKGLLTREEFEWLRAFKGEIVAFLDGSFRGQSVEIKAGGKGQSILAPLTFSQLMHWRFRRLIERPSYRGTAYATRLIGPLDLYLLRKGLEELVRQHEALRTQIIVTDGLLLQEINHSGECHLEISDLTTATKSIRDLELSRMMDRIVFQQFKMTIGPLWKVGVAKLGSDEHLLVIAMEHIVSDGISLKIFLRNLLTVYTQMLKGRTPCLPYLPIQFADHAFQQRNQHASLLRKHGAIWSQIATSPRVRFPQASSTSEQSSGWGDVPVHINKGLTQRLNEWCRLRHTTLTMGVFAAYVALALRWCNVSEMVIRFQSDGRVSPELENLIGFFAARLYMRIELLETDSFITLVERVKEEYCRAYERNDFSYMEAQETPPDVTRNTCFNWLPERVMDELPESDSPAHKIQCIRVSITYAESDVHNRDEEPFILLYDTSDGITGDVGFPRSRFTKENMERFVKNFYMFINKLLHAPDLPIRSITMI